MLTPGTSVICMRSTGAPALVQVVGHFTRDAPSAKRAKPPPKVKWSRTKEFYTEPLKE